MNKIIACLVIISISITSICSAEISPIADLISQHEKKRKGGIVLFVIGGTVATSGFILGSIGVATKGLNYLEEKRFILTGNSLLITGGILVDTGLLVAIISSIRKNRLLTEEKLKKLSAFNLKISHNKLLISYNF